MRRLFHQTKLYDYTSKAEAEKHITDMKAKGWYAKDKTMENLYLKTDKMSFRIQ